MKNIKIWFFTLIVFLFTSISYSQKIITGIYSGVNFSDIHGQEPGGKWTPKPGPAEGFYLEYKLNRSIGFQTGINYYSVYYEHKPVSYPVYYYDIYPSQYIPIIAPSYPTGADMDFTFLRIPVLFTVTIPSALQFSLRAGIFFSFLQDYSLNNFNYYPYLELEKPKNHDFGYLFSTGISYPITSNFKATFNVCYITGRKPFLENFNYRHGSSEFTLGVAYTGLLKRLNSNYITKSKSDSSTRHVIVVIKGGLDYSWNNASSELGNYGGNMGPYLGFSLKFPIGKGGFFQTGFSFERKGYSIRDSSTSFYRLIKGSDQTYYVNTKVQTDYAVIPALLSFPASKSGRLFFSTGPWLGLKLKARTVGKAFNDYHSGYSFQVRETIVYDDLEKYVKNYDLGWLFGCEMSLSLAPKYDVNVGLQYSIGFQNVFDNSETGNQQTTDNPAHEIRNRTISVVVGFKIPSCNRKN